jgi:hypothetical protein
MRSVSVNKTVVLFWAAKINKLNKEEHDKS